MELILWRHAEAEAGEPDEGREQHGRKPSRREQPAGGQRRQDVDQDEDGSNRHENISDWALKQFRERYADKKISKWDIFHYVYGVLHHPGYREKFADNLKRELPRIPFAPEFRAFAKAGEEASGPIVALENSAGGGFGMGASVGELATVLQAVDRARLPPNRIAICLRDARYPAVFSHSSPLMSKARSDPVQRSSVGITRQLDFPVPDGA